jgi:hypothetical protein
MPEKTSYDLLTQQWQDAFIIQYIVIDRYTSPLYNSVMSSII